MDVEVLVGDIKKLLENIGDKSNGQQTDVTLFSLTRREIARLKGMGSERTAETYKSALDSYAKYSRGKDISMGILDGDTLKGYEAWMKHRGLAMNTISFYMRRLRAVYNRGLRQHLYTDRHPFDQVYTGREETRKRAVAMETMKAIVRYTPQNEQQAIARDLFLFSFMTRGMSFVDIALLKKSDIKDCRIVYSRKKTGQRLEIELTQEISDILARHPSSNDFLLPIIKQQGENERNQMRYVQMKVNANLREIGRQISPKLHLTMYCARHSWATIARDMNVPISVISSGLGHNSERTTRIYLQSIDVGKVDSANASLIKALMEEPQSEASKK